MLQNVVQLTLGEVFLLELNKAESKGLIFAALEDFVAAHYLPKDLSSYIKKLSDFYSVAAYQSKLARIRIEYNAKAAKEISERLVGLNNFGQDNYKYKEKIVRKLNLLINNLPTLDELIYVAMAFYVDHGYGSIEDFKRQIDVHIRDVSQSDKLSVSCRDNVCQVVSAPN